MSRPHTGIDATIMSVLVFTNAALGQVAREGMREDPVGLVSDQLRNDTPEFRTDYVGSIESPGAHTIRVHFSDYHLGNSSFVTLTSIADGDVQQFNAKTLPQWYNWSAIFRGGAVDVELHVAPGDTGIYVRFDRMRMPEILDADAGEGEGSIASICGANDDRVASSDARVGRITTPVASPPPAFIATCTAWLVSNGAVLTAGHCIVAAGDLVEFGVPASTVNGNTNPAAVANQYPINIATVVSENVTTGQDWQVFGLNANTTTLRTAHDVQGSFRMTKEIPAFATTLRVTGYGVDNAPAGTGGFVCNGGTNHNGGCVTNANCPAGGVCTGAACCDPDGGGALPCGFNCNSASQTLQTTTGLLAGANIDLITHSVDTMPANSGSPIIWEANGLTIGIHTAGGCTSSSGLNAGTRFSRPVLETAIRDFARPNPIYVDASDYGLPSNGGVFEPFHNISQAIGAVPDGGTISLVPGFYSRQDVGNTFTAGADGKAMTFVSPAGSSFIGS